MEEGAELPSEEKTLTEEEEAPKGEEKLEGKKDAGTLLGEPEMPVKMKTSTEEVASSGKTKASSTEEEKMVEKKEGGKKDDGTEEERKEMSLEKRPLIEEEKGSLGKDEEGGKKKTGIQVIEPERIGKKKPITEEEKATGRKEDKGKTKKSTYQFRNKLKATDDGYWMEEIFYTWDTIRPHFWQLGSLTYSQKEITDLGFSGWTSDLPNVKGMTINMTTTNCHVILPHGA